MTGAGANRAEACTACVRARHGAAWVVLERGLHARISMEGTPLIEARDVVKRYGDKTVLDGLTLSIWRGETLVVIGGSGSGKSTLARVLIGLERPTSGSVKIDGIDLGSLSDRELTAMRRQRFAMVFQRHALLDSMTVFDNVAFPLLESRQLSREEISRRVESVLQELGLLAAMRKLPSELSGGMAKRVAIARAVVTQPEIVIYDEPTAGLDPPAARMVDRLIEQTRQTHLVTSVVITHDMATAYDVADRVALLARGRIAFIGPPEEIFASHQADMEPFARASGIDLARLAPRGVRPAAEEMRMRWKLLHHGLRHATAARP